MSQKKPEKRGRGRPRLHKDTELVTFRCPTKVAEAIRGALATIRLSGPEAMATPFPVFVLEALRLRVGLLANKRPAAVRSTIKSIDKVLDESYGHVER